MVMALGGLAARGGVRGVLPVAGSLVRKVWLLVRRNPTATAVGGGTAAAITVDSLIEMARDDNPESDSEALRDAAITAARMLGLDGSEVLWPTKVRGDERGEPIEPIYFTMHLPTGRAWYSGTYRSAKTVDRGFKKGMIRGERRAMRNAVQQKELSN